MAGWARIVIEFIPEQHDPNEVMLFLTEHFKGDGGVPTAEITFVGVSPSAPLPPPYPPQSIPHCNICGQSHTGPCGSPTHGVVLPYQPTQADLEHAADQILAHYGPTKKIQAIKELRSLGYMGLKEAKDLIDAAALRGQQNPGNPTGGWPRP